MAISKFHRRIQVGLLLFWTVVLSWFFWQMQAHGVDPAVLESDSKVRVVRSEGRVDFLPAEEPVKENREARLLFYPGALVDPDAYAPLAREVAEAGFAVTVVELPWRLAPLDAHKAKVTTRTAAVIAERPDARWVIGGHSLGARFAAEYAAGHADDLCGLLLIGSSHPRRMDLSGLTLDVTKILATNDGLASEEEVERFAINLSPSTRYVRIEGGNHSQFAWYGHQLGAGTATISRQEQHRQTVAAVVEMMLRVSDGSCAASELLGLAPGG